MLYIVRISDEDLAKLRQVKAEWKKEKYEKLPATTDDSKNEVNKISQDVGGLVYETGRKVIDSVVNGIPDFMNTFFAGDPKPASRDIPSYGRAKLGNYDELANRSGEINVPRIPTEKVLPEYEFKSQWARRDINGKVDGDSFKLGETTSTATSLLAPIIVGKVFTPPTLPQSLKTLGGIPEVESTTVQATKSTTQASKVNNVTQNTSKAIADVRKFSEYIFTPNSKGKEVVFKNMGYTKKDSQILAEIWKKQAAEKFGRGEYILGKKNEFGQRISIEIKLEGIGGAKGKVSYLKSGWMMNDDSTIRLATPFSGFTKSK